jgi:hypothetical protein
MRKILILSLVLVACSTLIFANIKLPALVGDNMVLQQQTEVKFLYHQLGKLKLTPPIPPKMELGKRL